MVHILGAVVKDRTPIQCSPSGWQSLRTTVRRYLKSLRCTCDPPDRHADRAFWRLIAQTGEKTGKFEYWHEACSRSDIQTNILTFEPNARDVRGRMQT